MKMNRRSIIKSLAAAGALTAMRAEQLLAQTQANPVNVLFVALQHGWGVAGGSNQQIAPDASQFGWAFPSGLAPFNRVRQHCVAVDGLMTMFHGGNAHDLSYADILTCGVPMGVESSAYDSHMPMSTTPSIDWLLQQRAGKQAFRFSAGYHSWGVPYHPLSFDSNATLQPFYTSAAAAKASLFSGAQASTADQRIAQGVFGLVKAPAFAGTLNAAEQAKIAQYVAGMTAAEQKLAAAATSVGLTAPAVAGQSSMLDLDAYLEMVRAGFATGKTDTAVLGIGDVHNIDKFHETHAHFDTPTYWQTRNDFAEKIASFVESLAVTPDSSGGMLLDNTIIVLTGEVGDGTHTLFTKGHILFGGARITPGRRVQPSQVPSSGWAAMVRENVNGSMSATINPGFFGPGTDKVSSRTNADLLREVGNLAGLNLTQFGLPSQNKGSVL